MKVAFVCLHYGAEYLGYAIKSIYDSVDKILIAYSEKPSHGHGSEMVNPDSRQACRDAAYMNGDPQGKIHWIDGQWGHEGLHRNAVFELYPNAELICVIDSDEIWHPHEFAAAQEWCLQHPAFSIKTRLHTPWRSFNWYCTDSMQPDRFYMPSQPRGKFEYLPGEVGIYYHMGYAIRPALMEYKWTCHGHKNEVITDWYINKFLAWSPQNNIPSLHPTCKDIWYAMPLDRSKLPGVLHDHPYWDKAII